jgi:uncharacterized protein YbjQ (UPF0145 family)
MTCPQCGKELTEDMIEQDLCYFCGTKNLLTNIRLQNENILEKSSNEWDAKREEILNNILITTTQFLPGYSIQTYKDIVTSEVFIGTGPFSELSASVSDLFGTSNSSFEEKLKKAKGIGIQKLKLEAHELNCNAIIGLLINSMMLINNMIALSFTGTAVVVEKRD